MCAQSAQIVATTKGILYSPWAGRLLVFPCQAEAERLHGLAEAWLVCLVCHSAAGSCVVIWSSDVLSRHVFEGRGRSDTSRQQKSQELKVELIKLSRKLQLAESLLLSSGAREEGLPEARVLAYRAVGPSLRVVTRRQGDLASSQRREEQAQNGEAEAAGRQRTSHWLAACFVLSFTLYCNVNACLLLAYVCVDVWGYRALWCFLVLSSEAAGQNHAGVPAVMACNLETASLKIHLQDALLHACRNRLVDCCYRLITRTWSQ